MIDQKNFKIRMFYNYFYNNLLTFRLKSIIKTLQIFERYTGFFVVHINSQKIIIQSQTFATIVTVYK
jgi:hypothetical protein